METLKRTGQIIHRSTRKKAQKKSYNALNKTEITKYQIYGSLSCSKGKFITINAYIRKDGIDVKNMVERRPWIPPLETTIN